MFLKAARFQIDKNNERIDYFLEMPLPEERGEKQNANKESKSESSSSSGDDDLTKKHDV